MLDPVKPLEYETGLLEMDVLVVSSERLHENTGKNFYIGSYSKPVKSIDNATLRHSYGCFWFDFWFEAKLLGISLSIKYRTTVTNLSGQG